MAYVLIVDDDEDFALASATVLQSAGHEVTIETSPQNALKSMQRRRPELIILDVMFPEDASAGFTLSREIRHFSDEFKNVPILMLTAVNSRFPLGFSARDVDEEWLPITDFLEKPVDLDVLLKRVTTLLEGPGGKAAPRRG